MVWSAAVALILLWCFLRPCFDKLGTSEVAAFRNAFVARTHKVRGFKKLLPVKPGDERDGVVHKMKAMWPAESKRLCARPSHEDPDRMPSCSWCLQQDWWNPRWVPRTPKMAQTISIWNTGKTRNDGKQTYSKSMIRFKLHSQMMADRIQSRFLHNAYTARGSPGGLGVGVQKIWMPTSKSILIYSFIHSFTH